MKRKFKRRKNKWKWSKFFWGIVYGLAIGSIIWMVLILIFVDVANT